MRIYNVDELIFSREIYDFLIDKGDHIIVKNLEEIIKKSHEVKNFKLSI